MAKVVFLIQREVIETMRSVRPKVFFPIETAFAAGLLRDRGHEIRCMDLNLYQGDQVWEPEFRNLLDEFQPDYVISAPQVLTFLIRENGDDTKRAFEMARLIGAKTIYCGPSATSYPHQAFKEVQPDYLVVGEYDQALLALIDQSRLRGNITEVPGVMSKDNCNGSVAPVRLDDLDILAFPAYEAFDFQEYFKHRGEGNLRFAEYSPKYTVYQTSRGCPGSCCFCNITFLRGNRKGFKGRSINKVLEDLSRLQKELGIEEVHFMEDNFNFHRRRTIELCRGMVERELGLKWMASGGLSVYSINEEVLHWMKRGGCYRLHLAIESGSQDVLDRIIKKPVNLKRDLEKVKIAKDLGFEIIGYFVIGLPGESREQTAQTIDVASSPFFDYVVFSIATPQAGTRLAEDCVREGLIDESNSLSDLSRRSTAVLVSERSIYEVEELRWKAWETVNFSDERRRNRIAGMMGLTQGELDEMRRETEFLFRKRMDATLE
jgi:magnesium-protoporphyrin IX monomethyl ester (oxidative) cyclase